MEQAAILIVEDDPLLVDALCAKLKESDIHADVAHTVADALTALEKSSFSLVLLDLVMPVQDGRDLLRALKDRDIQVPTLVVTNLDRSSVLAECLSLGAKDVVTKSDISIVRLMELIERYRKHPS